MTPQITALANTFSVDEKARSVMFQEGSFPYPCATGLILVSKEAVYEILEYDQKDKYGILWITTSFDPEFVVGHRHYFQLNRRCDA